MLFRITGTYESSIWSGLSVKWIKSERIMAIVRRSAIMTATGLLKKRWSICGL